MKHRRATHAVDSSAAIVAADAGAVAVPTGVSVERKYATLLERVQCLGMMTEMANEAERAGDLLAEVEALSHLALVQSPRLRLDYLSVIRDKCARRGMSWAPRASGTRDLPLALWQHVDSFLGQWDSLRLTATCRHMLVATTQAYPRAEIATGNPSHLLRAMRAVPRRFAKIGALNFVRYSDVRCTWGALTDHIVGTFGVGGLNVTTLKLDGPTNHWFELIRCCPNVAAIEICRGREACELSRLARLVAAATKCTSLAVRRRVDDDGGARLVLPARISRLVLSSDIERLTFADPTRLVAFRAPMHSSRTYLSTADDTSGPPESAGRFSRLTRLKYARFADAAVIAGLPCLLELVVVNFPLGAPSWVPPSLERLTARGCKIEAAGLAHCLRPESRLVSIRIYNPHADMGERDAAGRVLTAAFDEVATRAGVASGLRELILPPILLETDEGTRHAFAFRPSADALEALDASDAACLAPAFISAPMGANVTFGCSAHNITFLGRTAHATFEPGRAEARGVISDSLVVPPGLQLLLRSNACAVTFGLPLLFQSACSKSCIHVLVADH